VNEKEITCRPGCAACCIELSISSSMPGHPAGKPAGVACSNLTQDLRCAIFGLAARPRCCAGLKPLASMCGSSPEEARSYLRWLERETAPEHRQ
jgi:uncharacterized protein